MVMSTEENQGELKFGLHEVFFPPFLHTIIAFNTKKKRTLRRWRHESLMCNGLNLKSVTKQI